MEPNDLPIVCLPLELSGDAAEKLIDFLYLELTRFGGHLRVPTGGFEYGQVQVKMG